MGRPSKQLQEFMSKFKIDHDEIWEVRSGGAWAIKHSALERVATEQGIKFDRPAILEVNMEKKLAGMIVFGKLGEREEWATGEASPANNKNAYSLAMAEKRAKDRVVLKLLMAHGEIYSDEEADDFKRQNPHVTRVSDVYDGEISADIPDVPATKMKVKDARPEFAVLVKEMERIRDPQELYEWAVAKAEDINKLPGDWPGHFRAEYTKHKASIGKAAA
jgi:hypothetical protein